MFKVNNKDTNSVVLVSLLLTLMIFTPGSSVSVVNFEHVIATWFITWGTLLVSPRPYKECAVSTYCKTIFDIVSLKKLE